MSVTGVIVYLMLYRSDQPSSSAREHGGPAQWSGESRRAALTAESAVLNPHVIAGGRTARHRAPLAARLSLPPAAVHPLVDVGAWMLLSASMLTRRSTYGNDKLDAMAYGLSQFMGVLAALAVRRRDRRLPAARRGCGGSYGIVLLPVAIWFTLAPVALGPRVGVRARAILLIAGGMAAAAVAHLLLLRYARLLGAAIVGGALLAIAGLNVWMGVATRPRPAAAR